MSARNLEDRVVRYLHDRGAVDDEGTGVPISDVARACQRDGESTFDVVRAIEALAAVDFIAWTPGARGAERFIWALVPAPPDPDADPASLRFLSADDYLAEAPIAVDWVWDGYIARGALTLASGAPKRGKTTLVAALIAACAAARRPSWGGR